MSKNICKDQQSWVWIAQRSSSTLMHAENLSDMMISTRPPSRPTSRPITTVSRPPTSLKTMEIRAARTAL